MFWNRKVKIQEKPKLPNGRKYKLTLICLLLLTAGLALTTVNPLITKVYAEFAGGIIGILLVYCGGNVSNKWVLGKAQDATVDTGNPPANPPDNEADPNMGIQG